MQFPAVHPAVVGSLITPGGLRLLGRAKSPADVVEVRIDALLAANASVEQIENALQLRRQPVLLTLRIPGEGGHRPWKVKERRELFLRLLPQVEAVDIELASAQTQAQVIEEATRRGKTIIYSAHAIKRPATEAQVQGWLRQFEPGPGNILKIAARIKTWRDLQQLAALLINHPEWPLAVMGLGDYAPQSRSVLTALGSRLVYGYLDAAAAPGQPSAADARQIAAAVCLAR